MRKFKEKAEVDCQKCGKVMIYGYRYLNEEGWSCYDCFVKKAFWSGELPR